MVWNLLLADAKYSKMLQPPQKCRMIWKICPTLHSPVATMKYLHCLFRQTSDIQYIQCNNTDKRGSDDIYYLI